MTVLVMPSVPDLEMLGTWKIRAAISPHIELGEEVIRWRILPGLRDADTFGLLGDLTVSNEAAFGGVTVFMEITWTARPSFDTDDESHWGFADAFTARFGEWASNMLYDYAASAFNSLAAGTTYDLAAPFATPEHELVESDVARDLPN